MNLYESLSLVGLTILFVAAVAICNFAMMLGWNYAVTPTLGVNEIDFWQMAVLWVLCFVLFQTKSAVVSRG